MRLFTWLALATALLAAAGCGSRRGKAIQASAYRGVDQGALLAWAWGGAPGFEDDDPHAITVLFDAEPGDAHHRLMTCEPRRSECRSLGDFVDTGLEPEADDESFFHHFDTGVEKEDRLYLVVADRGARVATSEVIVAAAASRPTRYAEGQLRFDRSAQQLSWPRLPDDDLFLIVLRDEGSERPLTAVATRRKSWTYPELQGIVQYFHDPAQVQELRPGRRYVALLYSLNRQRWATVITEATVRP
jgi:hypothetical protein